MRTRNARAPAVLVAMALTLGAWTAAGAQDQPVRFDGRVQWVAGQIMAVQLDSGLSVSGALIAAVTDRSRPP